MRSISFIFHRGVETVVRFYVLKFQLDPTCSSKVKATCIFHITLNVKGRGHVTLGPRLSKLPSRIILVIYYISKLRICPPWNLLSLPAAILLFMIAHYFFCGSSQKITIRPRQLKLCGLLCTCLKLIAQKSRHRRPINKGETTHFPKKDKSQLSREPVERFSQNLYQPIAQTILFNKCHYDFVDRHRRNKLFVMFWQLDHFSDKLHAHLCKSSPQKLHMVEHPNSGERVVLWVKIKGYL